mgnify:CR=1 FL=1
MKNKCILVQLLLLIITVTVSAQKKAVIEGELTGLKTGTMVYLSPLESDVIDSVPASNSTFHFEIDIPEGNLYFMRIGNDPEVEGSGMLFYLQPGTLKIYGNTYWLKDVNFGGDSYATALNSLEKIRKTKPSFIEATKVSRALTNAYNAKDTTLYRSLKEQYKILDSINRIHYMNWAESHPSSPVSAMVLWFYIQEQDNAKLEKAISKLTLEARNNALYKKMAESVEAGKATAIGKLAPEFTQNDTLGSPVSLKTFRGKYLLIDFWASWCVPCRKENPILVKAYHKFKDSNFAILGVSLDGPNGKKSWLQAIKDDGLFWTQVSDLKFWDNAIAKQYNIRSIPSNFLLNPDGVIIAKNLHGEELEKKLMELLK